MQISLFLIVASTKEETHALHVIVIIAPSKEKCKLDSHNDCSEHNEAPTTINTFGTIGTKNTTHIIDLSCPYVRTYYSDKAYNEHRRAQKEQSLGPWHHQPTTAMNW